MSQSSVLETKDESLIKAEIKKYNQAYDRELKHIKRKEKRCFNISFPSKNMNQIRSQAKYYVVGVIDYIKLLVTADIAKSEPEQNTIIYKEILQILQFYKNDIQKKNNNQSNTWFKDSNYELLHQNLMNIHKEIVSLIQKRK